MWWRWSPLRPAAGWGRREEEPGCWSAPPSTSPSSTPSPKPKKVTNFPRRLNHSLGLSALKHWSFVSAGGDIGRLASRKGLGSGDSYKVLLIDDPRHTEKLGMRVPSSSISGCHFFLSRAKTPKIWFLTLTCGPKLPPFWFLEFWSFFLYNFAVENVLPQVVPSVTADGARHLFRESRQLGVAVVIVTVKVSLR